MSSKKYRLIKLVNDKFKGTHPNNIEVGDAWHSDLNLTPVIGESFHFGPTDMWDKYNHIWTSAVTEILEDGVFKTKNSTYKIEKL